MMILAVAGIVGIAIFAISYVAMDRASDEVGNVMYATLGAVHENGIRTCQTLQDDSARINCISSVDGTYRTGLLTLSLVFGGFSGVGTLAVLSKIA